jgi:hypothetical protein
MTCVTKPWSITAFINRRTLCTLPACRKEKTTVKKSNKHKSHQIECVVYCSMCVLERDKRSDYKRQRHEPYQRKEGTWVGTETLDRVWEPRMTLEKESSQERKRKKSGLRRVTWTTIRGAQRCTEEEEEAEGISS